MTIKSLLNKNIRELTLSDIEDYFKSPLEESDTIEYKSYPSDQKANHTEQEKKILKNICGMLNSSGGIIIWGAPKENQIDKKKVLENNIAPINRVIVKDHFISKTLSRLKPSPSEVLCEVIKVEDNKSVVIFEVPKGKSRPYQFDNRYYMRADGQTIIAPHHYIEALFKQISYPILEAKMEVRKQGWSVKETNTDNPFLEGSINLFISNQSLYQNEVNLYASIVVNNTYQSFRDHHIPVVHHGKDIIKLPILKLPLQFGLYAKHRAEVKILYGGEKSPLRCSRYLIEYSTIQEYQSPTSERLIHVPKVEILKKELNKFIFELEDDFESF